MTIKVLQPGLATSVQDQGRPGYYHLGIPASGGMDLYALTFTLEILIPASRI